MQAVAHESETLSRSHNPVIALSLHRSRSKPNGAAASPQTPQSMPIIPNNIPAVETAAASTLRCRQ